MRSFILLLVALLFILPACQLFEQEFDVLIVNGHIVDGTGNSWYAADLGIKGDRIVAIGKLSGRSADQVIDATGKVVSPGFIDMLGWSGMSIMVDGRAMSKISQGITTEVVGEGTSPAPVVGKLVEGRNAWHARNGVEDTWTDLNGYYAALEKRGSAINIASLIGATQVRIAVLGYDDAQPTTDQLEEMKSLVRTGMQQGALGIGSSLIYAPAAYATTQELIELTKVAAEYGGMYLSHIRDEGDENRQVAALYEAADIAKSAGCAVEIWHLKVAGKSNWGRMVDIVSLIDQFRSEGLDMTADVYPYIASSNALHASLPTWAQDGGRDSLLARLQDPALVARMEAEMRQLYGGTGIPFDGVMISEAQNEDLKQYEGQTLIQIASQWKLDPYAAFFEFVRKDSARTGRVTFSMSEPDLRMAMAQPWTSFCTDASLKALDGEFSDGKPHPRAYGSMTRVLGKYVREDRILTLEDAVRKMSSQPAQRVGLRDRGLLKPGFFADVVVFDPETVTDKATFVDPHQYSVGVEYVLVNGKPVWQQGEFAGNYPGRGLRGPGWTGN